MCLGGWTALLHGVPPHGTSLPVVVSHDIQVLNQLLGKPRLPKIHAIHCERHSWAVQQQSAAGAAMASLVRPNALHCSKPTMPGSLRYERDNNADLHQQAVDPRAQMPGTAVLLFKVMLVFNRDQNRLSCSHRADVVSLQSDLCRSATSARHFP